jgi:hypothetical protein
VEGVLGGTVQVGNSLLDGGNAVKHGTGEGNIVFNTVLKVIKRVDLGEQEHLGVCGPQHNDLVIASLASTDVLTEGFDQFLVGALEDMVATISLVSGDKVRVKDSFHGLNLFQVNLKLLDQGGLKHVSAFGSLVQVEVADVPATDVKVNGVHHGEEFLDGLKNVGEGTILLVKVETNVGGSALGERAVEVSLLFTSFGSPGKSLLVGDDTGDEGGTVVATETDKHDSEFWDALVSSDGLFLDHGTGLFALSVVK